MADVRISTVSIFDSSSKTMSVPSNPSNFEVKAFAVLFQEDISERNCLPSEPKYFAVSEGFGQAVQDRESIAAVVFPVPLSPTKCQIKFREPHSEDISGDMPIKRATSRIGLPKTHFSTMFFQV